MKKTFLLIALVMTFSNFVFADIILSKPTPDKTPRQTKGRIEIQFSTKDKQPRLIIPKNMVSRFRAELEQIENETDAAATVTAGESTTKTQLIFGGMFLSLAMIFGGVWFSRSRNSESKNSKIIAAGAILFLIGSMATVVFANVGPPLAARSITSKLFNLQELRGWNPSDNVLVETSNQSDRIILVVPAVEDKKPTAEE